MGVRECDLTIWLRRTRTGQLDGNFVGGEIDAEQERRVTAVSFDVDGTLYSDRFLRTRVAWEAIRRGSLRDLGTLRNRRDPASDAAARLAAVEKPVGDCGAAGA